MRFFPFFLCVFFEQMVDFLSILLTFLFFFLFLLFLVGFFLDRGLGIG